MILVDSGHWRPMLEWIHRSLSDNGLISPADEDLLLLADHPEQVCEHVRRASAAQKEMGGAGDGP